MTNLIAVALYSTVVLTPVNEFKDIDLSKPVQFSIAEYVNNHIVMDDMLSHGFAGNIDIVKCGKFAIAEAVDYYVENPAEHEWLYDADFQFPALTGMRVQSGEVTYQWACDQYGYTEINHTSNEITFTSHLEMFYHVEEKK